MNRPRVLQTEQKATVIIDGHEVITLSSNNYLGLTVHPALREAAIQAINKYGVGSGSVRTIAGTMSLHVELEEKLARFKHTEASLTQHRLRMPPNSFAGRKQAFLVGEGDLAAALRCRILIAIPSLDQRHVFRIDPVSLAHPK